MSLPWRLPDHDHGLVRVSVRDLDAGLLVTTGLPGGLVGQWHLDEARAPWPWTPRPTPTTAPWSTPPPGSRVDAARRSSSTQQLLRDPRLRRSFAALGGRHGRGLGQGLQHPGNYPQVVSAGDSTGMTGYNLYFLNDAGQGAVSFIVRENGSGWGDCFAKGTTNLLDNTWHHLAGVYRGNSISVYLDGRLDSQSVCQNAAIVYGAGPDVEIGRKASGGSVTSKGRSTRRASTTRRAPRPRSWPTTV